MKRVRKAMFLIVPLIAIGVLVAPSTAFADTSSGYISGSSPHANDWGDEGTLSESSHAWSGAVGLWQTILYADGAKAGSHTMTHADIDCHFGDTTLAATKYWQSHHGLTADGNVGPNTFTKAEAQLKSPGDDVWDYKGSAHTMVGVFQIGTVDYKGNSTGGVWWFLIPNGDTYDYSLIAPANYASPITYAMQEDSDATDHDCIGGA